MSNTNYGGSLTGQHAVVTGGSRGIGKAIAQALLQAGAQVTIVGRSAERLQVVAAEIAVQVLAADVTDPDAVEAAFRAISVPITILVNNAGNAESASFRATDLALWNRMLAVNLTATYLCTHAVVEAMVARGSGRIVNVASTAALTGYPYVTAYCAAKHGVLGLTRALALELARSGVTVNAVCPGYTETEMLNDSIQTVTAKTGRSAESVRAEFVKANPQGRFVEAAEVAHAVLWLCLPESQAITGQSIAVAGGEVL